jgi:hypothetical protein
MAMKTINPTDRELIEVIGSWNTEAEMESAGYYFRPKYDMTAPELGEVVVIESHGKLRRGIVVAVGLTNAKVALTTPGAVDHAARHGYELTRVKGKPVAFNRVGRKAQVPADVCGCDRNPLGHTREEHPTEPAAPEMTAEEADQHSSDYWEKATADLPREPAFTEPTGAGSSVVTVLEKVWRKIQANHPELPDVVIVTGSGMIGPARWGHFRANGWTERAEKEAAVSLVLGEMFIAGETLAKGAAHTVETMLHEGAHVLAKVREIQDTSRQNRWHNRKFLALAEELGLSYGQESAHPQIGFSQVTLTPETTEEYAEVIAELDAAIRLTVALPAWLREAGGEEGGAGENIGHHGGRKPKAEGAGSSNNLKATCGCEEPRIIRASRKVLEADPIICGKCREEFTVAE